MTDIVVIYRTGDLLCSYNHLLGHAVSTVTYHEIQIFSSLKSLLPILFLLYAFEYLCFTTALLSVPVLDPYSVVILQRTLDR